VNAGEPIAKKSSMGVWLVGGEMARAGRSDDERARRMSEARLQVCGCVSGRTDLSGERQ